MLKVQRYEKNHLLWKKNMNNQKKWALDYLHKKSDKLALNLVLS